MSQVRVGLTVFAALAVACSGISTTRIPPPPGENRVPDAQMGTAADDVWLARTAPEAPGQREFLHWDGSTWKTLHLPADLLTEDQRATQLRFGSMAPEAKGRAIAVVGDSLVVRLDASGAVTSVGGFVLRPHYAPGIGVAGRPGGIVAEMCETREGVAYVECSLYRLDGAAFTRVADIPVVSGILGARSINDVWLVQERPTNDADILHFDGTEFRTYLHGSFVPWQNQNDFSIAEGGRAWLTDRQQSLNASRWDAGALTTTVVPLSVIPSSDDAMFLKAVTLADGRLAVFRQRVVGRSPDGCETGLVVDVWDGAQVGDQVTVFSEDGDCGTTFAVLEPFTDGSIGAFRRFQDGSIVVIPKDAL